ncbi:MAG TPA: type IIL restriction-modification enzyme MmeI, partial [Gemmataceae bacterium]|nr:type IIL restriction-modification enzyme MmeI [Gemmataceae bacterium]
AAQAHVNRNISPDQQRFLACLPRDKTDEIIPEIRDFPGFTHNVLGWDANDLLGREGGEPVPASLDVPLTNYQEVLRPTYAVREFKPKDPENPWLMLIQCLPTGTPLDKDQEDAHWQASPHAKLERLLRETRVPIGLLCNGTHLRFVYAPRGETSGYLTFVVAEMISVAGRPIFAGLFMLLGVDRLFTLPEKQRLPAILADSRKYQNVVSTKLAGQMLAALYELVRGFQAADDQSKGKLLGQVLAGDPNEVYGGLLTVLMRLVFVLYAEDRGLLSSDPVYVNYYAVTGLFERLRADAGRFPDTMNQRYGAWAQLLTLFRLIYEGGRHGAFQLPARKGYLFDPDRYPFLEGRADKSQDKCEIPRVSDGVLFRVLSNLLILDGERLSYRTLDVEQIGSVYETMMGFDLEVSAGRSIAIKPTKSHGAPSTINLEELLNVKPADRAKWLAEKSDQKLTGEAVEALKRAATLDDLLAALEKKIAKEVTPNVVPAGAMILQPSDERRRSGSHYTPRILTEPIVRKTLEPILKRLGDQPTPSQILGLKICDLAMGSAAFLVETCRQLGDVLVASWHAHKQLP